MKSATPYSLSAANTNSSCFRFISAVHIPSFSPGILISGGGDSVLRLWDWINGKPLRTIDIFSAVQPFIVVKPPKKKMGRKDEDQIKGKRRRGRNKAKFEDAEGTDDRDAEDSHGFAMHEEQLEGSGVFVVHKVASIPSLAQIIVFSVVG
jgi:tRNA (guanine-N(7)-)-methyltransferase subunit TRM82